MIAQTQPDVVGYQVVRTTCDTRSTGHPGASCTEPHFAEMTTRFVGTPWASVGIDLGRVTLHAQAYANVFGPGSIIARSPAGVSITTRVTF